MASFQVLTGEDAEKARLAGAALLFLETCSGSWCERVAPEEPCEPGVLYRVKPEAKKVRRPLPLPDLRALAGAMLVDPAGDYFNIDRILADGQSLYAEGDFFTSCILARQKYRYSLGGQVKPCWTETEATE